MILDTCAAGAAATSLMEKREISTDQIRALERLKDRTGFHVLMGSAADSVSYEASQYEQGLLTYALLPGMRGAALRDDVFVDVNPLFQYAADTVPTLAEYIGGIQRPRIVTPRDARSFDIGLIKLEDRKAIPQAVLKPLLLRPSLQNSDRHWDNLELTIKIRELLRRKSYSTSRGESGQLPAVYVNVDEYPGAIRPSGSYSTAENVVTVHLVFVMDGTELTFRQVNGTTNDIEGLVRLIVDKIIEVIAEL
jgi:hypothetical protein